MQNVWDPERVQNLSAIMPRYAPYVRPGDVLTLGVEGDPCNVYGSDERVRVAEVWNQEGEVRFRATRDGHEDMILDATSIDPKKTWEPHRDSLEEIAARVEADVQHDGDSESTVFRASVDARFEEMEKTLQTLKEAFKETTEHLRCFAEDLKHGKATFAATYAATYDRVQAETTAVEGAGEAGAASERDSTPSVYAGEKTDFHVESPAAVADKTVFHVAPSEEKTTFGATTRERKTRDDNNSVELSASEVDKVYEPFREVPP